MLKALIAAICCSLILACPLFADDLVASPERPIAKQHERVLPGTKPDKQQANSSEPQQIYERPATEFPGTGETKKRDIEATIPRYLDWRWWLDTPQNIFSFVLAVIGTLAFWAAYRAANAAKRAAAVSEATFRLANRAFIYLKEFRALPAIDSNGKQLWLVQPVWENNGTTPTRRGRSFWNCDKFSVAGIPDDFQFPDNPTETGISSVAIHFGPKAVTYGQPIRVYVDLLRLVQSKEIRIFLWGWVDYDDILAGSPRHRTEFCHELTVTSDPTIPIPNPLTFEIQRTHNGSDDECFREPAPYKPL